jgi:hypothetical protein
MLKVLFGTSGLAGKPAKSVPLCFLGQAKGFRGIPFFAEEKGE